MSNNIGENNVDIASEVNTNRLEEQHVTTKKTESNFNKNILEKLKKLRLLEVIE